MWWQHIIIAAVILFRIYGFLTLTSFETRVLSRRTTRRAADLYPRYADSLRKQRRYAKRARRGMDKRRRWPFSRAQDTQPHEHGKGAPGGPASGSA